MKENIPLQEIIAYNNTDKAQELIASYGYEPARNYDELVYKLLRFSKDYREEAIRELANLHPHKDLILNFESPKLDVEKKECSCKDKKDDLSDLKSMEQYLNAEGDSSKDSNKSKMKLTDYLPVIAVAGLFALAIVSMNKRG